MSSPHGEKINLAETLALLKIAWPLAIAYLGEMAMFVVDVIIIVGWFFICFMLDNIANGAHGAGLLYGVALGYAPLLWRDLTGKS